MTICLNIIRLKNLEEPYRMQKRNIRLEDRT
nr:MAG TPA: hypothetical protein [Caudoviricetes sp.]